VANLLRSRLSLRRRTLIRPWSLLQKRNEKSGVAQDPTMEKFRCDVFLHRREELPLKPLNSISLIICERGKFLNAAEQLRQLIWLNQFTRSFVQISDSLEYLQDCVDLN